LSFWTLPVKDFSAGITKWGQEQRTWIDDGRERRTERREENTARAEANLGHASRKRTREQGKRRIDSTPPRVQTNRDGT